MMVTTCLCLDPEAWEPKMRRVQSRGFFSYNRAGLHIAQHIGTKQQQRLHGDNVITHMQFKLN